MDALNLKILDALQADARMATTAIAEQLDRSESTVRERIRQLERKGVISGYAARVNPERVGLTAKALVRASTDYGRVPEAARQLALRPHVLSVYRTSGRAPLTYVIVADSSRGLEALLARDVADLQLRDVEVDIVLATIGEDKPLPLRNLREKNGEGILPAMSR